MASPTHQFEIKPLVDLQFSGIDLSFTNSSLWMAIAALLSVVFFVSATRKKAMVPSRVQAMSELSYAFIANMVRENIGTHGRQYFPLIFTIFMVVFLGNALGLIPYSFTYTSHIAVTAALAVMVFLMVIVIGIFKHGMHFFSLFLPPGVPLWLMPLVIPIEILSFCIRPVTLSVRLFANMIAGHILLKVIAGFSVGMISMGAAGYALGILPMLFNVILIGFEFLIAFLQAYVFAILSCIYLKDTVELEH
ncbi:MAG: F0F1 ATP synthase subunit A [Pseudomonadota bacterium]|nr:F0F1 ATP synthase subunit A [Alphaproteobacteria bacterium]MCS5597295.1 F0F1 ATP synthase subunit A [Alphaproteobacteria bacterium]MEC7702623.1 F0F1 ATP synthase subunit A [Pseudomonadota bacterium]MED5422757.1 F0F1 ATP synthase subunit A [Pseudomonadota bacterium]MEE3322624.1 F0F1 ATP synthase subunit A [Pseudomonadota bacterium]